jgi:CDGSH-type Zn-finger protein
MTDAKSAHGMKIVIIENGPYEVSGAVPLAIQIITEDDGNSWDWTEGKTFPTQSTYKLCRCGRSKTKPFCDGSHTNIGFDGEETASRVPIARQSETYDGPTLTLSDAEDLCAFARFCDPGGKIWSLIGQTDNPKARELVIREAMHCPAGGWSCTTRRRARKSRSHSRRRSAWSRIRPWGAAARCGCAAASPSNPRTARRMKSETA